MTPEQRDRLEQAREKRRVMMAQLEKARARRDAALAPLVPAEARVEALVEDALEAPVDAPPIEGVPALPPSLERIRTRVRQLDRGPAATVKASRDRLKRVSLSMVHKLETLTDEARVGPVCKTCGRGTLREEELRLKALNSVLDRAGIVAPKSLDANGESTEGPMLVFPPGTSVAIVAKPPEDAPAGPRLTRGDQLDA